jgi:hypothetical protein
MEPTDPHEIRTCHGYTYFYSSKTSVIKVTPSREELNLKNEACRHGRGAVFRIKLDARVSISCNGGRGLGTAGN